MSLYPKVFSLSTVNITRHGSVNFFFNSLCTAITGESGTGKSIIADLIQLILVGHGKFKSSTDTKGVQRQVHGLVSTGCKLAYAFMNIQVSSSEFVVIGVYIEKAHTSSKLFSLYSKSDGSSTLGGFSKPLYNPSFK